MTSTAAGGFFVHCATGHAIGEQMSGSSGFSRNRRSSRVLGLGLFQPADDHDRQIGLGLAQLADKLRAAHAGHQVVGDDQR